MPPSPTASECQRTQLAHSVAVMTLVGAVRVHPARGAVNNAPALFITSLENARKRSAQVNAVRHGGTKIEVVTHDDN